jgi:hypothetical protein
MGLSYVAFIMLRYIPSVPRIFKTFIIKRCWLLSKALFCIYWDDHVSFDLDFVYMLCYIYDLHTMNHPRISGMKPIWSCIVLFVTILLRIFFVCVHQGNWSTIFFVFVCPYQILIPGWDWFHRMSLIAFLPFCSLE